MPKYIVTREDGSEVDCPCVVFLAQDIFAPIAVGAYYDAVLECHPSMSYKDAWLEIWFGFWEWHRKNAERVKIPD